MNNEDKKNIENKTETKIMMIDDDVNMMDVISDILLKYGHKVFAYTEPVSAIESLKESHYDILIVNYLMSPVNGDRIVELVREFNKDIYIILMSPHKDLIPSMETMNNLDIQAYYEKSSNFEQLIILIQGGIKYIEQLNSIKKMSLQLENYLLDFANILLQTVNAKDNYTGEHSYRVSKYSEAFSKYIGLTKSQTENLRLASLFHDIGKIGIPDNILQKESRLTDEEFDIIKLHPIIGANIFSVSEIFKSVSPGIRSHHEKYNGNGYPDKLKGDHIPYIARILAITDAFDAIVAKRPYKEKNTIEFGLEQIKKGENIHFDPDLAEKFIQFVNEKKEDVIAIDNYENTSVKKDD